MGKRLGKVRLEWTPDFAYALGLIATDGNLSPDGRHIHFTSKDRELAEQFKRSLGLSNKIGKKGRGGDRSKEKKYFVVQFGDKNFYNFLLGIGLTPAKSKSLGKMGVPRRFLPDFFRGCVDGDGNIGAFVHPESQHPQLRLRLYSASIVFLAWILKELHAASGIEGGWIKENKGCHSLCFGIQDSLKLLRFMYYKEGIPRLGRKYKIAEEFLRV